MVFGKRVVVVKKSLFSADILRNLSVITGMDSVFFNGLKLEKTLLHNSSGQPEALAAEGVPKRILLWKRAFYRKRIK